MSTNDQINEILNNKDQFNEVLKTVFDEVDTDHSGFIDQNEFFNAIKNVFSEINASKNDVKINEPTIEQTNVLLKDLDKNQDGKLSMDEFSILVRKLLESLLE